MFKEVLGLLAIAHSILKEMWISGQVMPPVECAKQGHILVLLVMMEFIQDVTETGWSTPLWKRWCYRQAWRSSWTLVVMDYAIFHTATTSVKQRFRWVTADAGRDVGLGRRERDTECIGCPQVREESLRAVCQLKKGSVCFHWKHCLSRRQWIPVPIA